MTANIIIKKPNLTSSLKKDIDELSSTTKESIVMILADVSGSMLNYIEANFTKIAVLKSAIQEFINFNDGIAIGLISFSDNIKLISMPTRNYNELKEKINYLSTDCCTNMGEALIKALSHIKMMLSYNPRIVLVSDGNATDKTNEQIIELARSFVGKAKIDTVAIGKILIDNFELLRTISEITGGKFTICDSKMSMLNTFKQLSPEKRYMIEYK